MDSTPVDLTRVRSDNVARSSIGIGLWCTGAIVSVTAKYLCCRS